MRKAGRGGREVVREGGESRGRGVAREGGESRRSRGVRGCEEEGVKSAHEFAACEQCVQVEADWYGPQFACPSGIR